MKRNLFFAFLASAILVSCSNGKTGSETEKLAEDPAPDVSSIEGQRDSLMSLIGDISENIIEVNRM